MKTLFLIGCILFVLGCGQGIAQNRTDTLPSMKFVDAPSVLKGVVSDPALKGDTVSLLYYTLSGMSELNCIVDQDGHFSFELYIGYPTEMRMGFSSVREERISVFLMPGKESTVEVGNRSRKLYYKYSGAFARVNEEFANRAIHTVLFSEIWKLDELPSVKDVDSFRDHLLAQYLKIIGSIEHREDLSPATKRLIAMQREIELYALLKDAPYYLSAAGIVSKDGNYTIILPEDYFLPLSDLPSLSDPMFLYCFEYTYLADQIRAVLPIYSDEVLQKRMYREQLISKQDSILWARLNNLSNAVSLDTFTSEERERLYRCVQLKEEYKKQCEDGYWSRMFGTDSRFIKEYWEVLDRVEQIHSFIPLTENDKQQLKGWNFVYFRDMVLSLNSKMEMKKSRVLENDSIPLASSGIPEFKNLFFSLYLKHRGKPVLLVFWEVDSKASRIALNALQSLKRGWEERGLRVISVASEYSKEEDWKQLIYKAYPGRHIRLSQDQMRYLHNEYYMDGLPTYFLIDKKGTIIRRFGNIPVHQLGTEIWQLLQ